MGESDIIDGSVYFDETRLHLLAVFDDCNPFGGESAHFSITVPTIFMLVHRQATSSNGFHCSGLKDH